MLMAAKAAHERPKDVLAVLAKRFPSIKPLAIGNSDAGSPFGPLATITAVPSSSTCCGQGGADRKP